jgi:hypothetical protein
MLLVHSSFVDSSEWDVSKTVSNGRLNQRKLCILIEQGWIPFPVLSKLNADKERRSTGGQAMVPGLP